MSLTPEHPPRKRGRRRLGGCTTGADEGVKFVVAFAQRQLSPRRCRCSTTIEKTRTLVFQGITKIHEGVEGYPPPRARFFLQACNFKPKAKSEEAQSVLQGCGNRRNSSLLCSSSVVAYFASLRSFATKTRVFSTSQHIQPLNSRYPQ